MCQNFSKKYGLVYYIISMLQKLPGILLLLTTPCSVYLFMKVATWTGSEVLALFSALLLYVAVVALIAVIFGKKKQTGRK